MHFHRVYVQKLACMPSGSAEFTWHRRTLSWRLQRFVVKKLHFSVHPNPPNPPTQKKINLKIFFIMPNTCMAKKNHYLLLKLSQSMLSVPHLVHKPQTKAIQSFLSVTFFCKSSIWVVEPSLYLFSTYSSVFPVFALPACQDIQSSYLLMGLVKILCLQL